MRTICSGAASDGCQGSGTFCTEVVLALGVVHGPACGDAAARRGSRLGVGVLVGHRCRHRDSDITVGTAVGIAAAVPLPAALPEAAPSFPCAAPALARRLFAVHYHSTLTFAMRRLFCIIDTIKFLFLGTLVFIYTYSTHVSFHQEQNRFSCPTSALGIP